MEKRTWDDMRPYDVGASRANQLLEHDTSGLSFFAKLDGLVQELLGCVSEAANTLPPNEYRKVSPFYHWGTEYLAVRRRDHEERNRARSSLDARNRATIERNDAEDIFFTDPDVDVLNRTLRRGPDISPDRAGRPDIDAQHRHLTRGHADTE